MFENVFATLRDCKMNDLEWHCNINLSAALLTRWLTKNDPVQEHWKFSSPQLSSNFEVLQPMLAPKTTGRRFYWLMAFHNTSAVMIVRLPVIKRFQYRKIAVLEIFTIASLIILTLKSIQICSPGCCHERSTLHIPQENSLIRFLDYAFWCWCAPRRPND